ncbi:helix-turn-helix transcriptional regulator [Methyloparacoccus murrellii]
MEDCYLRVEQIIGNRKAGTRGLLPISKSHFWRLIERGDIPRPLKIGSRVSLWRERDIRQALARMTGEAA